MQNQFQDVFLLREKSIKRKKKQNTKSNCKINQYIRIELKKKKLNLKKKPISLREFMHGAIERRTPRDDAT